MKITETTIAQSYDEDGGKVYRHYVTERKGVTPKKKKKEKKPEIIKDIISDTDDKIIVDSIIIEDEVKEEE